MKINSNMKTKYLLLFSPFILALDFYLFGWITELLTKKSDAAVFVGVSLSGIFIFLNYILIKFITQTITQLIKTKKDEKTIN